MDIIPSYEKYLVESGRELARREGALFFETSSIWERDQYDVKDIDIDVSARAIDKSQKAGIRRVMQEVAAAICVGHPTYGTKKRESVGGFGLQPDDGTKKAAVAGEACAC